MNVPLLPHYNQMKQFSLKEEATIFFEILEQIGFKFEDWTKGPYFHKGDLRHLVARNYQCFFAISSLLIL